jgi:hypothetical protein
VDVHVPAAVTEGLRRRGIDVLTSQSDGTDRWDDESLLQRATDLERILFSQDEDLLPIAAARQSAGRDFAGLIYAHQLGLGIGQLIDDLELLCVCAEIEEIQNHIVYLPLHESGEATIGSWVLCRSCSDW